MKKSKENKGIKIISERVNTPFKEIKKEEPEEEEEEQFEEDFNDSFDFQETSSRRAAPVLEKTSNSQETIEDTLRNTPSAANEKKENVDYVANMPKYSNEDYEARERQENRRVEIREFSLTSQGRAREQGIINPRQMQRQEENQNQEQEERRYQEIKLQSEEERRMPLRRERRRERILK